jgi:hypothetical protein
MAWKAYLNSDAALAQALGVHRRAVQKAEARGKIVREPDRRRDAFAALDRWRCYTRSTLQRSRTVCSPWLDPQVPLTRASWNEYVRRIEAAGAEIVHEPAPRRTRKTHAEA